MSLFIVPLIHSISELDLVHIPISVIEETRSQRGRLLRHHKAGMGERGTEPRCAGVQARVLSFHTVLASGTQGSLR